MLSQFLYFLLLREYFTLFFCSGLIFLIVKSAYNILSFRLKEVIKQEVETFGPKKVFNFCALSLRRI